jgi:diketogulonate reductase-like aldo/keto reductase
VTALDAAVRSGRALIAFVIHRPSYSMLNRWVDNRLLEALEQEGVGCIAFSPLVQKLLTTKYLNGIPDTSRASQDGSLRKEMLSERNLDNVGSLNPIAGQRGRSLPQMALAWVLGRPVITSALIGASKWPQIEECLGALRKLQFSRGEIQRIDHHAVDSGLNIWARFEPIELGPSHGCAFSRGATGARDRAASRAAFRWRACRAVSCPWRARSAAWRDRSSNTVPAARWYSRGAR